MRFIVDEYAGPTVARWLLQQGHDVYSVYDQACGANDDFILDAAVREDGVIVTNDKDFGEMIFRLRRSHRGVILLRLGDERPESKVAVLAKAVQYCSAHDVDFRCIVAADSSLRISGG